MCGSGAKWRGSGIESGNASGWNNEAPPSSFTPSFALPLSNAHHSATTNTLPACLPPCQAHGGYYKGINAQLY